MNNTNNSILQQTPPIQSTPSEKQTSSNNPIAHQKGKLLIILGAIFVLLVVGTGAYYLKTRRNRTPHQQQNTTIPPSPTSQVNQPAIEPNVNLPLANIKTLRGKLLYRLNDQILVSNLDGSNPMELVKSTNALGYAGWSDEGNVVYYTELIDPTSTLYKKDLTTGTVTKLFEYDSREKNVETHFGNVKVSSDGKFAVYSHSNGNLSLYDLTNKTARLLLSHRECLHANTSECYGYFYPDWSPNNQRIVVRKMFYEGATQVVVNSFAYPVTEKDIKAGGSPPEWSSDSRKIIIPGAGYWSGSLYLVTTPDDPVNKDLLSDRPEFKGSAVTSSALSMDGKIAFTYSIREQNKHGIALYDLNTGSVKPLIDLSNTDNSYVWVWTDNNNLLYKDGEHIWSLNVNTLSKTPLPIEGNVYLIEMVP